jgi:hypothetical protein
MEGPTCKKTKEPPKRPNHKGNIKFLNFLMLQEAYQIMKGEGPSGRMPSLEEPSSITIGCHKIKTACTHCNTIDTSYL